MGRFLRWLQEIGDWPTNKVRGAAVLLLFGGGGFFLRGWMKPSDTRPDKYVRATSIEPPYSVAVDVDEIFIGRDAFESLDEADYFVDRRNGVAIRMPSGSRTRIEKEHLSSFYMGLSTATVPFFGHLTDSLRKLALTDSPEPGDIATTRLLLGRDTIVGFDERSWLGPVPMNYNPLREPGLAKATTGMVLSLLGNKDGETLRALGVDLETVAEPLVQELVEKTTKRALGRGFPAAFKFTPGLTIKSFDKRFLSSSPLAGGPGSSVELTGFGYFVLLQMLNPELATFALSSLDVSRDGNVFLYDMSMTLRDVQLDDRQEGAVELVKLFLIIEERWRVHAIRLQYLNGKLPEKRERELESALRSVRVLAR